LIQVVVEAVKSVEAEEDGLTVGRHSIEGSSLIVRFLVRLHFDRSRQKGRVKEFCWPTTDGDAITVPFLVSSYASFQEPKSIGTSESFSFGGHKTTEQTKVLSESDVYLSCAVEPSLVQLLAWLPILVGHTDRCSDRRDRDHQDSGSPTRTSDFNQCRLKRAESRVSFSGAG
jgi:hypothetical protein